MYPVSFYPEAPYIGKMESYDQFLPYILDSDSSEIHWSFGLRRDQEQYALLKYLGSNFNLSKLRELSSIGFDSIEIEKSAGSENTNSFESILKSPYVEEIYSDERRSLFKINKAMLTGKNTYEKEPLAKVGLVQCNKTFNCGGLLVGGWSDYEDWGVWGVGKIHTLVLPPLTSSGVDKISLRLKSILTSSLNTRTSSIYLNNQYVGKAEFNLLMTELNFIIKVPDHLKNQGPIIVKLVDDVSRSPAELKVNVSDERKLGVGLISVEFLS